MTEEVVRAGHKIVGRPLHVSHFYPGVMTAPNGQRVLDRDKLFGGLKKGDHIVMWSAPVQPYHDYWDNVGCVKTVEKDTKPITSWMTQEEILDLGSSQVSSVDITLNGIWHTKGQQLCFTMFTPEKGGAEIDVVTSSVIEG